MRTEKVFVTPEMAKQWLSSANWKNRRLMPTVVARYACDMKLGFWALTHQGIAFRSDGTLADGQHRLAAVVKSEVGVWMLVTFGMDEPVVDLGNKRQPYHVAAFDEETEWMSAKTQAVAAFMLRDMLLPSQEPCPASRIIAYGQRYRKIIEDSFDMTRSNNGKVAAAGIRATYACALYAGVSEAVIQRFAYVLRTGNHDSPAEWAASRLREYLLTGSPWCDGPTRKATACKAHKALSAFANGYAMQKLTSPGYFIYPVPPEA